MKIIKSFLAIFLFVVLSTCATTNNAVGTTSANTGSSASDNTQGLAGAVKAAADYFVGQIPAKTAIAITGIDAENTAQSDYIIEELGAVFGAANKFSINNRQNAAIINAEGVYQAGGDVDDETALRIGHQLGVSCIIHGKLISFGDDYRLTLYATMPEQGISLQQTSAVKLPRELAPARVNLDASIERALVELGRNLTARTSVGIERIGYKGYDSVSEFSEYLKVTIGYKAAQQSGKYQIINNTASTASVIKGSFYPQNDGVAVILQLVSTLNDAVLGASKFTISQRELDRNKLSILPPNTTLAQLDRVSRAIAPYSGKDNRFTFTVKPERPDALYHDGDNLSFSIYSAEDCYFMVLYVDVKGSQEVMFPRKAGDDNFIRAGQTRVIPDKRFILPLGEPYGIEYELVAAYREQFVFAPEDTKDVSDESIMLALKGQKRKDIAAGSVSINNLLEPVATGRFSYTILP